jgi:hypothetical protein
VGVSRSGREPHAAPGPLGALAARWQQEADLLRRRGATAQADLLAGCAGELAAAVREHELAELTVTAAAAECGYSPSRLRALFPGRKTIPRGALPRKARRATTLPDLAEEILDDSRS